MKLITADQIKELDQYTIAHEPISSVQLMERAATACTAFILNHFPDSSFCIIAGTGNNAGDGLAIARLLDVSGLKTEVILTGNPLEGSADFKTNLERLKLRPLIEVHLFKSIDDIVLKQGRVIVDCLFGTGIKKAIEGPTAQLIKAVNNCGSKIISIDVPSGLPADLKTEMLGSAIVKADITLSFHIPKISFLFEPFARFIGQLHVLDIGLNKAFHSNLPSDLHFNLHEEMKDLYRKRDRFSHKSSFGHGLLVAGSKGKIGAAVLSASAFLRSGAGLITAHIPACGYDIMQTTVPEAMCIADSKDELVSEIVSSNCDVIVAGPGIGTADRTAKALEELIKESNVPLVLDADALNLLALNSAWWNELKNRELILTPHPGEFERLFQCGKDAIHQFEVLKQKAIEYSCIIVLKGAFTRIAMPNGEVYFNSSGNSGMSTAGSGDVLSGIIAGLMCSGYSSKEAALLGVYLHGLSGDIYAAQESQESLTAGDLIKKMGAAWRRISA